MPLLVFTIAYLAGSVNFSILVFKITQKGDPRDSFSGNPGMTNVFRQSGFLMAAVVLLLDMGRSMAVAILAAGLLSYSWVPWIGFGLIVGNRYPCFHGFRGGKGVANYLGTPYVGLTAPGFDPLPIPLLAEIPVIGAIFFSQDLLVYLTYLIPVLMWIFLYNTRFGLSLRAAGEYPAAATAAGLNVVAYRWLGVLAGGFFMGLGGAYLSLAYTHLWTNNLTAGRGWIAVALVIFAFWRPGRAVIPAACQPPGWLSAQTFDGIKLLARPGAPASGPCHRQHASYPAAGQTLHRGAGQALARAGGEGSAGRCLSVPGQRSGDQSLCDRAGRG